MSRFTFGLFFVVCSFLVLGMVWQCFVSAPHPQSHMFGTLFQGWERNMLPRHGVSEPKRVSWSVKKSMPQPPAKVTGQVLNREAKQKGYTG